MFSHQFKTSESTLRAKVPDYLKPYFFSTSSSTEWLKALSNDQLQVRVLRQGKLALTRDEYSLLKLRHRTQHLVREVEIIGQGVPWMLARSVFPEKTLSGKLKSIKRRLSNQPLGEILFKEPSLRRSEYEFAFLESAQINSLFMKNYFNDLGYNFFISNNERLWCRRSIFFIHEKPILLTEIFLPALVEQCEFGF